jgi:hypothetical protein
MRSKMAASSEFGSGLVWSVILLGGAGGGAWAVALARRKETSKRARRMRDI